MSTDHIIDEHGTGHSASHSDAGGDHSHGLTDMGYVKVALVLAMLTGLEVALTYIDLPGGVFLAALLVLMVLKFWTVVSYFMHLKFDNPIFTKLFYAGLFLALGVFGAVLACFQFFVPS